MSFIKAMLVFQGMGMARGSGHVCSGPMEPLIPGIMPGAGKPKIILAQDMKTSIGHAMPTLGSLLSLTLRSQALGMTLPWALRRFAT
eukprot:s11_g64.t1